MSAGFIDMHFHGAGGFDICDANAISLSEICKTKLSEGVTSIIPATLTLSEAELVKIFENLRDNAPKFSCKILGVHLEGPFINPEMLGAQNAKFIQTPNIALVKRLSKIFKILKLSFSPELNLNFLKELLDLGIIPSCAHSNISFSGFEKAHSLGLKNITHFGNRLSPIGSRDIGATGAGLLFDDVYLEIIADKLHLSSDMLRLIFAKKPHSKIALISDSMRASGMPEGEYSLGGVKVIYKDNAARTETGALAGSVLKIHEAVGNVMKLANLPLGEACKLASENVANSLSLKNIGKIEESYAADFVVLSSSAEVLATIVDGEILYKNSNCF